MSAPNEPWKPDPEMRRKTTRFGLIVLTIIITVMIITAVSRFYGW
jgi:hypothetical protein